ncbi:hypothetical protein C6Q14_27565 [Burkholderia ambifaria]|uniref:hypothetical protein n=1 Tax=Burkholderia ambifaria TaxID=152480 RepID=UPI000CFF387B|nr:hypothetical protein [Burkholderia ambifaria]MBR8186490.1 hypothetical protein [Burkholderia ambifaria]PRF98088.1 hypothetical protein C6Q14_27565 [Burkholderia ambifaria]
MGTDQSNAATLDVVTTRNSSAVQLNRSQILQLLAMTDDESSVLTVQFGAAGHSGAGLYAWDEDYPDEGANFLDPAGSAEGVAIETPAPSADDLHPFPPDLHPRTANLVRRFHVALAAKLAHAERKYGHADSWASPGWMDECREQLQRHVAKGDPLDVAAYSAFLWHHGEPTVKVAE